MASALASTMIYALGEGSGYSAMRGAPLINLSVREALSGVMGSISLVSWIVLLLPQLIENYKNGRADALSLSFLTAWLIGDICNLIGAAWGRLLPTVIALAVYFCFADIVLLGQTLYYNHMTSLPPPSSGLPSETSQLLSPSTSSTRRRRSSISVHRRASANPDASLSSLLRKETTTSAILRNALSILAVCVAGTLGWFVAYESGAWKGQQATGEGASGEMPVGANVLGYMSAALYLVARLPQIWRNYREKSCEGLSLLFFLLSILGNLTYGAGILLHSTERGYVLGNLPWLLGSLGTMLEDFFIFFQFHLYAESSAVVDSER